MGFFEPPPPPSGPLALAVAEAGPPWFGPPEDVLAGVVAVEVVVARTDDTVVAVTGVRAYPTGFGFTLCVRLRALPGPDSWLWQHAGVLDHPLLAAGELPDEVLRFGVRFADGRKATTLDPHPYDTEQQPQGPVLLPHGGGGGGRAWDMDHWVWPLPPPGLVAFACEWPLRQIPETLVEIDSRLIIEAAGRAVQLWPNDGTP
jgi:hypothetical protein